MKKFLIIAIVIAACALVYYFFFTGSGEANNPFQISQITAQAFSGDLIVSIHSNGTVTPVQTVEVKSKASGEIIEMSVDVGDYIHKGDLICRLDTTTVTNDYLQSKADYNVAETTVEIRKRDFERQKSLFEKGLISQLDLDESELLYEQAVASLVRSKSSYDNSIEALEDTEIRSPIDGIILQKPVEKGQIISSGVSNVSGGTQIIQVAQMDSVYVVADVDETDIGKVKMNQKVKVTADAHPDKAFQGRVEKIAPIATIDQNVTVFEVTTLIDNSQNLLKAGMNCSIEVITSEAYGAVLVPVDAVKDPQAVGYTGEIAQGQQTIPSGGGPGGQGGGQMPNREEMRKKMQSMTPEQRDSVRQEFMKMRQSQMADAQKKVVMVKKNGEFVPELVTVGESNLDYTQVITGIAVGDTVDATPTSMMMQQRQEMRERMKAHSNTGGFKSN